MYEIVLYIFTYLSKIGYCKSHETNSEGPKSGEALIQLVKRNKLRTPGPPTPKEVNSVPVSIYKIYPNFFRVKRGLLGSFYRHHWYKFNFHTFISFFCFIPFKKNRNKFQQLQ